jgi:paraquat-inducible protein A
MIACRICGQVHASARLAPGTVARCTQCGTVMHRRVSNSLQMTAAFSLAAMILYVPANVFPILRLEMYGAVSENTVWDGCVRLFQDGQWGIAVIVFLASILIPLLKLLGLFILVVTTMLHTSRGKLQRTWIFKVIESVGRWAMLDVFVMAILVSLVKLQRMATIIPGKGLIAFTGVVVLTLLASASCDPHAIWNEERAEQ